MEIVRDKYNVLVKPGMLIKHPQYSHVEVVESNGEHLFAGGVQLSVYLPSALEVVEVADNPIRGLMSYCPITGERYPYPSTPETHRLVYTGMTWKYNPYSGTIRNALDIESDPYGLGIVQDGIPQLTSE